MKQKRLYLLYNVFVLIVQHCYLLYNIVTNVQRYNLYNLDKKIVQFTKGFAKVSINILFCIVQSVVLYKVLYNHLETFSIHCTTFDQIFSIR